MSKAVYDLGIVGGGVSSVFAAKRAAENFKNKKIILFELNKGPAKRRRQLEGWMGCFPFSDGKIHTNEVLDIMTVVDGRKAKPVDRWVRETLAEAGPTKIITDKLPNASFQKKATELGFDIILNDYIQWKPEYIHKLSKIISDEIQEVGNIELSFDNEVLQILKKDGVFELTTQLGNFYCKKVIMAVGRSGWRWAHDTYNLFGLTTKDDYAYVGITVECSAQYVKELNKTHCSLLREDLEIGPFCWDGAIIPEDHADVVLTAFRSNEDRWKRIGKDKVSFNVIKRLHFPENGIKEMERLAKLALLMFNDRIGREKIKSIIKKESVLSQIPEYDFLIDMVNELEGLLPNIINRGYFHAPTIKPQTAPILLGPSLETEINGLYAVGESAGFFGINAAAISGVIALDGALR